MKINVLCDKKLFMKKMCADFVILDRINAMEAKIEMKLNEMDNKLCKALESGFSSVQQSNMKLKEQTAEDFSCLDVPVNTSDQWEDLNKKIKTETYHQAFVS